MVGSHVVGSHGVCPMGGVPWGPTGTRAQSEPPLLSLPLLLLLSLASTTHAEELLCTTLIMCIPLRS